MYRNILRIYAVRNVLVYNYPKSPPQIFNEFPRQVFQTRGSFTCFLFPLFVPSRLSLSFPLFAFSFDLIHFRCFAACTQWMIHGIQRANLGILKIRLHRNSTAVFVSFLGDIERIQAIKKARVEMYQNDTTANVKRWNLRETNIFRLVLYIRNIKKSVCVCCVGDVDCIGWWRFHRRSLLILHVIKELSLWAKLPRWSEQNWAQIILDKKTANEENDDGKRLGGANYSLYLSVHFVPLFVLLSVLLLYIYIFPVLIIILQKFM